MRAWMLRGAWLVSIFALVACSDDLVFVDLQDGGPEGSSWSGSGTAGAGAYPGGSGTNPGSAGYTGSAGYGGGSSCPPGSGSCDSCATSACCSQYSACKSEPACGNWSSCYFSCENQGYGSSYCIGACGSIPDSTTQYMLQCLSSSCYSVCS